MSECSTENKSEYLDYDIGGQAIGTFTQSLSEIWNVTI